MCSCQQQKYDSLMDGPTTTGFRSSLSDTTTGGETPTSKWAIDGKAPWTTGERLLGAVGAGLIVGAVVSAVVIRGKKK